MSREDCVPAADAPALGARLARVRAATVRLLEGLEAEDAVVQSMADASPAKWHLAHTTWFFEEFVLAACMDGYARFHDAYAHLFNSYYNLVGPMHRRSARGLLSRPTLKEVLGYRAHVDAALTALLERRSAAPAVAERIVLGCHHEQQHQELFVTDIKHVLAQNPLAPSWRTLPEPTRGDPEPLAWTGFSGGLTDIGDADAGFAFDNERPRHPVYLEPFAVANRLVTSGEFREFVSDGGYRRPEFWLSDGWSRVQSEGWSRPLYWSRDLEREFTVAGLRPLELDAPVCHVSYFEADAFARWAGSRLATEGEWEHAAAALRVSGNLADSRRFHPARAGDGSLAQFYGDVWEWTASAYLPYPGYRTPAGAIGEYNGKFMSGQMVLRGGSCATPDDHVRLTYRNFFYPHQRWQFSGIRLVRDL